MPDILDDFYESDLTEEEHERLVLMSEHAIAKPLLPATQAVLHAIAAVLRHIADTEGDAESWYAIPASTLVQLAAALTAPSLLERAMKGDAQAARQFLHEAGFTDASGNWLPQYQSTQEISND